MSRRPISKRLRFEVLHRDGFRCRYCGTSGDGTILHIDHVLAVANGGTNEINNLIAACIDCNLGKGATALLRLPTGETPLTCPFADGWPYEIEDPVFYLNDTWAVTDYGLECLITYYPIPSERLAEERGGMADWLLHLAEKEWAAEEFDDFVDAFRRALTHHRITATFDLEASIREASREAFQTGKGKPIR